jgi:hypothetical protein
MRFQIEALPQDTFQSLFALDGQALAAAGAARVRIAEPHAAPCRISLVDAPPGETLILAPFVHQSALSPYRASGPIFVRQGVARAALEPGDVPDALRRRVLSLRAYDAHAEIIDADVVDGRELEPLIARLFARAGADYLHAHFAKRGCYAAKIVRAS